MSLEVKSTGRKSNVLGLYKISENVTVLSIAEALKQFSSEITGISTANRRNNIRTAQVTFSSIEACEKAKALGEIKLDNTKIELHYAHGKPASNLSASPNKVYVKYPSSANFEEISKLFGDVSIKRPENATNYFFATCKDIDEQCKLVKQFDQMQIAGGVLNVKVAIDKTVSRPKAVRN